MTPTGTIGCGPPEQGEPIPPGVDLSKETVITGYVRTDIGEPVAGAYVRLLDSSGEFAAEVVSSAAGQFRFFATPGAWTVRALSRSGDGTAGVQAERGVVTEVRLLVGE